MFKSLDFKKTGLLSGEFVLIRLSMHQSVIFCTCRCMS
jgi:hypothetical protein